MKDTINNPQNFSMKSENSFSAILSLHVRARNNEQAKKILINNQGYCPLNILSNCLWHRNEELAQWLISNNYVAPDNKILSLSISYNNINFARWLVQEEYVPPEVTHLKQALQHQHMKLAKWFISTKAIKVNEQFLYHLTDVNSGWNIKNHSEYECMDFAKWLITNGYITPTNNILNKLLENNKTELFKWLITENHIQPSTEILNRATRYKNLTLAKWLILEQEVSPNITTVDYAIALKIPELIILTAHMCSDQNLTETKLLSMDQTLTNNVLDFLQSPHSKLLLLPDNSLVHQAYKSILLNLSNKSEKFVQQSLVGYLSSLQDDHARSIKLPKNVIYEQALLRKSLSVIALPISSYASSGEYLQEVEAIIAKYKELLSPSAELDEISPHVSAWDAIKAA